MLYEKNSFKGVSTNRKLAGISELDAKMTALMNISVSVIVNFCIRKCNFSFGNLALHMYMHF